MFYCVSYVSFFKILCAIEKYIIDIDIYIMF